MNRHAITLLLLPLLALSVAAQAAGDAEAGRSKSAACAGCHGPDGNSPSPEFPKIAGQHAAYLEKQLRNYKSGARENAVMAGMVAGLSEQDMADLAAFYASQKATATPTSQDLAPAGEAFYKGGDTRKDIAACMACHGPDANGNPMAAWPMLAGQHAAYTEKTLKHFRDGTRANDPNQMMRLVAAEMSDKQIKNVAAYLSGVGVDGQPPVPPPAAVEPDAAAGEEPSAAAAEPEKTAAAKSAGEDATSGRDAGAGGGKSGQEVIKTACAACHATGAAGAPKLGDTEAWKARADKGLDTLVSNSINGIGAMPPRGGHMNLTDAEMRAAVVTMLEDAGVTP